MPISVLFESAGVLFDDAFSLWVSLMARLMSSYLRSRWKRSCELWMFLKENPDRQKIIIKQCAIIYKLSSAIPSIS